MTKRVIIPLILVVALMGIGVASAGVVAKTLVGDSTIDIAQESPI